jgi:hypothetical protein
MVKCVNETGALGEIFPVFVAEMPQVVADMLDDLIRMPSCRARARRLMNRICHAAAHPARAPTMPRKTAKKRIYIKVLPMMTGRARGAAAKF